MHWEAVTTFGLTCFTGVAVYALWCWYRRGAEVDRWAAFEGRVARLENSARQGVAAPVPDARFTFKGVPQR